VKQETGLYLDSGAKRFIVKLTSSLEAGFLNRGARSYKSHEVGYISKDTLVLPLPFILIKGP